ncbi:unnamed protein product, partial [marine sediment metagenome]
VAICTNTSTDDPEPQICADGAGGAIITWTDNRTGTGDYDIYAQRVNSTGDPQWTDQGEPVCTYKTHKDSPEIIGDGSHGAVIAWEDSRNINQDIYAQRINSNGITQWTSPSAGGKPVCTFTEYQYHIRMCTDGVGGAIITWNDARYGSNNETVFAQRIDVDGNLRFSAENEKICIISNNMDEVNVHIISGDNGGAIIAWEDNRTSGIDDYLDIYAQKINSTGDAQWDDQGKPVCTADFDQWTSSMVSDGSGGAIIAWGDDRHVSREDAYIQKINSFGDAQWTPNGLAISTKTDDQYHPEVCSDGAGGAYVAFTDKSGLDEDVYAQHVNSQGIPQWTIDGVIICNENDYQYDPEIISDEVGGAIIVWWDYRDGNADIYAQRVEKIAVFLPSDGNGGGDDNVKSEVFDPTMIVVIGLIVV